jgi:DNA modification methylase
MIKTILGDSTEEILKISPNSVDLVILDPDYQNWGKLCNNGFIENILTLLKSSGNILCFTKQPFDFELRNKIDPIFRRELIWSFTNGGAWVSNKMPLVSFQKIYWCVSSKDFYINVRTGLDYSEGTGSFKRKNKVFENYNVPGKQFTKSDKGTWIRDHYHYNKPHTGKIPSKPEKLIEILVNCFCPEGGLVLDPFMGSGVIGKISKKLKRDYIGVEIQPEVFKIAKKNIVLSN